MKNRASKMTIEKLARITAKGFADIHRELATKVSKTESRDFATKEDLKSFATKKDLENFILKTDLESMGKRILITTIESNDKLGTKIDTFLKERAAHDTSHKRMQDTLDGHEVRIRNIERLTASDK